MDVAEAMELALAEAAAAGARAEVPVGAVVLSSTGELLAAAGNERQSRRDPTAHAEVLALRAAGQHLGDWQLAGCSLVVTLEPCTMCAGAVVQSRVERLVFGAWDEKAGAVGSLWDLVRDRRLNHRPEVLGGLRKAESSALLLDFFTARR